MKDPKPSLDLSPLENDYEIVGQLDARDDAQTFIATRKDAASKRRDDQSRVQITVVASPAGDEGNALSHLAADTKTLAGSAHRRLIRVMDGRWLGDDAFAVVTERITDPSLAQLLEQGATFSNPRAAAILREVNGLLEWAREQQIIHRAITADRIFLEPRTDRVRVAFAVLPVPRIQRSSATDTDARTIAALAMVMLTGNPDAPALDREALAALRPDLPSQLLDATVALRDPKNTGPDVPAYLALVGMAEPLFIGESEASRVRAEVLEEQRVEREKLALERADFERNMADERERFAREREEFLDTAAKERAALESSLAADREQLLRAVTDERKQLLKDIAAERETLRLAVETERATLATMRAELERAAADRLAALERTAADDRAQIEALRAELQRAGELEIERKRVTALDDITDADSTLDDEVFVPPVFVTPALIPLDELTFSDDGPLMEDEPPEFATAPSTIEDVAPQRPAFSAKAARAAQEPVVESVPVVARVDSTRRRRFIIGSVVAVLLLAGGATAVVITSNQRQAESRRPVVKAAAVAPVAPAPVVAAPLVPLPSTQATASLDSSRVGIAAPTDSASRAAAAALADPAAAERAAQERRDALARAEARRIRRAAQARDSIAALNSAAANDSMPLFRAAPARPDTTSRPVPPSA